MRIASNPSRLLFAVMTTIICSYGTGHASEYQAAQVRVLTDSAAQSLLNLDPPPPPTNGRNAEPGVPFVKLTMEVWDDLVRQGVTEPLMTLPTADHQMRVLVDPLWQEGELSLPQLGSSLPIILVNHVNPPAPFPGGCGVAAYCKTDSNGRRCYSGRRHWYVYNPATNRWCEQTAQCTCP